MCEHAAVLRAGAGRPARSCGVSATRAIVRVLGCAGPGYEEALAGQLEHDDEQTGRDALQALAHIGSAKAAAIVGVQIRQGTRAVRAAAEEALRHFPPRRLKRPSAILLARREFVMRHPQIAVRLIDRAGHAGLTGLDGAMRDLAASASASGVRRSSASPQGAGTLLELRRPSA